MWEELLKEVTVIKWGVVCIAVSLWGLTIYFLLKGIPEWWNSPQDEKEEPFTLEKMKKDLESSSRPRKNYGPTKWD